MNRIDGKEVLLHAPDKPGVLPVCTMDVFPLPSGATLVHDAEGGDLS